MWAAATLEVLSVHPGSGQATMQGNSFVLPFASGGPCVQSELCAHNYTLVGSLIFCTCKSSPQKRARLCAEGQAFPLQILVNGRSGDEDPQCFGRNLC